MARSRPRRRGRFTISLLMSLVAVAAVWLAYERDRFRPIRAVEIAFHGSGEVSLGDETLSSSDLTTSLREWCVERVVIVVAKDVPYSGLTEWLGAIASAGVRDVRFTRHEAGAITARKRAEAMLR